MVHVDQEIEAADAAYGQSDLDEAERHLRAVLAFDPEEPRALHRLGHIAMKRDQPEVAADYFQQSLAAQGHVVSDSSATIPTPTLAELYVKQGYIDAAADIYHDLLERHGEHERAPQWRERLAELAPSGEVASVPPDTEGPGAEAAEGDELPGPIPGLQEAVQALPADKEDPVGSSAPAAAPAAEEAGEAESGAGEGAWQRARRLEDFLERVAHYRQRREGQAARRLEAFVARAERFRELRRLEHFLSRVDAHRGIRELERLNE